MAVIDTYFEWALALRGSSVIMLPGGLSAEQYLTRLDILIKEQFSRLTAYDEVEYADKLFLDKTLSFANAHALVV